MLHINQSIPSIIDRKPSLHFGINGTVIATESNIMSHPTSVVSQCSSPFLPLP